MLCVELENEQLELTHIQTQGQKSIQFKVHVKDPDPKQKTALMDSKSTKPGSQDSSQRETCGYRYEIICESEGKGIVEYLRVT